VQGSSRVSGALLEGLGSLALLEEVTKYHRGEDTAGVWQGLLCRVSLCSVTGQSWSVCQGVSLTHACGTMPGCSGELVGCSGHVEGFGRKVNEPGRLHQKAPPHPLIASYQRGQSCAHVPNFDLEG
jgi:hypothetical protein